ncbi:MAG: TIGR00282 family metallophosphoesterase [Chthoniobacterales bacterium]
MIRILFLGDIVGEPGRQAVIRNVPLLRQNRQIDFVIVNGENAASGRGITSKIAIDLLRCGVAVITTGDHVWDQKELADWMPTEPRLLRPANYPAGAPGSGSVVLQTAKGKVAVLNLQGRTFMNNTLDNPFLAADEEVAKLAKETKVIFVDMHCETTSEKVAMGRHLDGRVSAVVGTHTHVQTADERIFPGGTAFICDAGMCGPDNSVIGREVQPVLSRFRSNLPTPFPIAKGVTRLCGLQVDIEEKSGRAVAIERVSITD